LDKQGFLSDVYYVLANFPEKNEEEILQIISRLPFGRKIPMRSAEIHKVIREFEGWVDRVSSKPDFIGKFNIESERQGKVYIGAELKNSIATFQAYPFKDGWIYWY